MKKIEGFLQKMGVNKEKASVYAEKIVKILAIVVVIVILLILSQLAVFYGIFVWIGVKISVLTGLDQFITKGIAFLLMAILFGTPLGSFIWSFTPVPQKNKKRKRAVFLIILAILSFAAFFASQNVYFNVKTGEAEKYYSVGVDGKYVFYSKPGYDPMTGDELLPVTKEIIREYLDPSQKGERTIYVNGKDSLNKNSIFPSYTLKVANESLINLFFVYKNIESSEEFLYAPVPRGGHIFIELYEGRYYIAFLDRDLNQSVFVASPEKFISNIEEIRSFVASVEGRSTKKFLPNKLQMVANNNQAVVVGKYNIRSFLEEDESSSDLIERLAIFVSIIIVIIALVIEANEKAAQKKNDKADKKNPGKTKEEAEESN